MRLKSDDLIAGVPARQLRDLLSFYHTGLRVEGVAHRLKIDTLAFRPSGNPFPCVDERLGAGSLGFGSAEAPGVELMRVMLSNLAPPLGRAALRLSDRSVTGLRGRRPCARHARSRPWTPQ